MEDRELAAMLLKIARQAAYEMGALIVTSNLNDRISVAVSELVEPKNMARIKSAKNPKRLAFVIAKRAILKMCREKLPYPVSRLNIRAIGDNNPDPTISQKLEKLLGGYEADGSVKGMDAINTANVFPMPFAGDPYAKVIIEIAKSQLPEGTWDIIDMRLEDGMQWDEIAKVKGKTVRQVRHAYKRGLQVIEAYLRTYVFDHTQGKRLKLKPVKKSPLHDEILKDLK